MKLSEAIKILEKHNKWRRGDKRVKMAHPKDIGNAIDIVVEKLKKL